MEKPNILRDLYKKDFIVPESITYRIMCYKYSNDNSIDKIIESLIEIVDSNSLRLEPVTRNDFVCIYSFITCMLVDRVVVKSLDYEDIFLYQLVKSIFRYDKTLLSDLSSIKAIRETPKINAYIESEEFTYNLIKRVIKLACREKDKKGKLNISDGNNLNIFMEVIYEIITRTSLTATYISPKIGDSERNRLNNKLTVYSINYLTVHIMGQSMSSYLQNMVGNDDKKESSKEHPSQLLVDALEMLLSQMRIMSNQIATIDVISEYEDYVKSVMFGINLDLCEDVSETFNKDVDLKPLKERIKEARRTLYSLKGTENSSNDSVIDTEEEINSEIIINEEELRASESITLEDKLKSLSDLRILMIGKHLEQFENLGENIKTQDVGMFKGKSIDSKIDVVVKLTVGMKHSQSYDIDSEIKKSNAKLVTTSRMNKNLVLDDILNQI